MDEDKDEDDEADENEKEEEEEEEEGVEREKKRQQKKKQAKSKISADRTQDTSGGQKRATRGEGIGSTAAVLDVREGMRRKLSAKATPMRAD